MASIIDKEHITVKVFHISSAQNKDFNITLVYREVRGKRLSFIICMIIPDYKTDYTASLFFICHKC